MNRVFNRLSIAIITLSILSIAAAGQANFSTQASNNFSKDDLAPYGSAPTEEYETDVSFDSTTSTYIFKYLGGEKISYFLAVNDPEVQLGQIKISAQIGEADIFYPVVSGGSRYMTQSQQLLEPIEFARQANIQLTEQKMTTGVVSLTYSETLQGISHNKTIEYSLRGKTLVIHISSDGTQWLGNYAGFSFGASQNTPEPQPIEMPYLSEPLVVFGNQHFFSTYLDRTKSHSIDFSKVIQVNSDTSIQAYLASQSSPDSQGQIAPLDETGYVTVSDTLYDVMPRINNPPSPFRDQLTNKAVLDLWWVSPVEFGYRNNSDTYKASKVLLDSLNEYGLIHLAVIYHDWQRYGYDVKLPTHYPANPDSGTDADFAQMIKTAKEHNYLFAVHENYVDTYPDSPSFNSNDVAKNADLSNKLGWYNSWTGSQAFILDSTQAIKYAEKEGQQIKLTYAPNAAFLDVDTAWLPTNYLNFDASAAPGEKSFAAAVSTMKNLFNHQRNQYGGPLFGEGAFGTGRFDTYYAGYVDGVERQIEGNFTASIIPDYELIAVKPLMVNQGMGYYGRFFALPGQDDQNSTPTTNQWDQYRAFEIAFGHAAFISNATIPGDRSIPMGSLSETFTEYFLLQAIQQQYLDSKVTSILYEDNGKMVPLGQAIADQIDFSNARLLIQYENGLSIYLNFGRGSKSFTASLNHSIEQGNDGWFYQYWNNGEYSDMSRVEDRWQGDNEWCRLWNSGAHPSTYCQPTLTWKSPMNGTIIIDSHIFDQDPNCGNGITAEIYQNDKLLSSEKISNGDVNGANIHLTTPIKSGEEIHFRIDANGNQDCDSTSLDPTISFESLPTNWEVTANGTEYSLPANGWVAWNSSSNFLAYSLNQGGQHVDYVSSSEYTFLRSRNGKLQTIGDLSVDGTVALTASEVKDRKDIHFVQTSQVMNSDQSQTFITTSCKSDLNLKNTDTNHIQFILHHSLTSPAQLTYSLLPEEWLQRLKNSSPENMIKVWRLDATGSQTGTPITYTLTASGNGISLANLSADQWYEIEFTPPVEKPSSQTSPLPWWLLLAAFIITTALTSIFLRRKTRNHKEATVMEELN